MKTMEANTSQYWQAAKQGRQPQEMAWKVLDIKIKKTSARWFGAALKKMIKSLFSEVFKTEVDKDTAGNLVLLIILLRA